jgi:hypothetical protein
MARQRLRRAFRTSSELLAVKFVNPEMSTNTNVRGTRMAPPTIEDAVADG